MSAFLITILLFISRALFQVSLIMRLQNRYCKIFQGRFRWSRGLRRWSAAARLLGLWVRIPPEAWVFVCCECCVLSGTGLCDELITRPEESYRMWCVVVCYLEISRMRKSWPSGEGGRNVVPQKFRRLIMHSKLSRNIISTIQHNEV